MKALSCMFLSMFALQPLQAADHQVHCPDPATIVYTAIPSSIHGFYTATRDGVGFWGMDIAVLRPEGMTLAKTAVTEVNDYWSLACVYTDGQFILNMGTNPSPVFRDCHFADGSQSCEGSIEACVLSCPELPQGRG